MERVSVKMRKAQKGETRCAASCTQSPPFHDTSLRTLHFASCASCLVAAVLPEVEQLAEAGETASALEEVVAHELPGAGAALDVDAKADRQEGLELLGQLVGLLEAGRAVCGDEVERFEGLFVEVRRLGFDHFDGHDT